MIRRWIASLVLTALAISVRAGAAPPGQSGASQNGVAAVWDVRNQLTALAAAIKELDPLVSRADPKVMADNGAPEAYVQQVRSVQAAMKSLLAAADGLGREPEKMPVALDVYFQMERMELLLNSLRDGIRKYQSPDLANMLTEATGKNAVHRDRLRQHIQDLAQLKDEEYQIANEEAQRCRGTLTKQPVSAPPPTGSSRGAKQSPGSSQSPLSPHQQLRRQ